MKKKFKEILEKEPKRKKAKAKGFYFVNSKVLNSKIKEEEKLHSELAKRFKSENTWGDD